MTAPLTESRHEFVECDHRARLEPCPDAGCHYEAHPNDDACALPRSAEVHLPERHEFEGPPPGIDRLPVDSRQCWRSGCDAEHSAPVHAVGGEAETCELLSPPLKQGESIPAEEPALLPLGHAYEEFLPWDGLDCCALTYCGLPRAAHLPPIPADEERPISRCKVDIGPTTHAERRECGAPMPCMKHYPDPPEKVGA